MKISTSTLIRCSALLAVFYFYFYAHIVAVFGGKYCYPVLFTCIGLSIVGMLLRKQKKVDLIVLLWILILCLSLITNRGLQAKAWLWPVTFSMLVILLLPLSIDDRWIKNVMKMLMVGSLIYCIATIVLYVAPGLYSGFRQYWGYYPNGTERGMFGYRAGIADNHSANGIYCVIAFLIMSANYIVEQQKKKKKKFLIVGIISLLAVLLTTKRAHLLFGVFSVLVCYYFSQNRGKVGRGFKICFVSVVALILFYLMADFVPAISDFMEGFEGQDDISNGRYVFWEIAWNYFKSNPLFGIGWLGFRYSTRGIFSSSGYVDVHNVYIQLLAETGIFGTGIMLSIFIATLVNTIQMLNVYGAKPESDERMILCVSLGMQVFCLIYGVTGNFLYDRACFIYIFACAMSYSIKHLTAKKPKRESENDKLYCPDL